ncbi:MAG: pirin family protein [Bacteroidota bacterium]
MTDQEKNPILKTRPLGFQWEMRDPFLFCAHHEDKFPRGNEDMGPAASLAGRNIGSDFELRDGWRMYHGESIPGFPEHPHRGFETVTIVREGLVDHADSMGAAGRYGNGDVQWMTAGKGVQHSEMFPLLNAEKENPAELFQIWLNLPKKNKMSEPHFKMMWEDLIPKYTHPDDLQKKTVVEIIAGTLENLQAPAPPPDSWAADSRNEVAIWNITMEPNACWTIPPCSEDVNRTLFFYKGESIKINGEMIPKYHAVEVIPNAEILLHNSGFESGILLLQGKPIGEPVVQYGPFVMNSDDEIRETFAEYRKTHFGGWPWPVSEQVHERNKTRFALHADGTLETRP